MTIYRYLFKNQQYSCHFVSCVRQLTILLSCSLIIASCALQPLYGKKNSSQNSNLHNIYVENIPEREGQFLRAKISQLLNHGNDSKTSTEKLYNLKISISEHENLISNNYQNRDQDWWQIKFLVDMVLLDNNFTIPKEQNLADVFKVSDSGQVKKILIRKKFIELGVIATGYSPISFMANKSQTKELMLESIAHKILLELTLLFQEPDTEA